MTPGCPRDIRPKNFLLGLIFRSRYRDGQSQLRNSSGQSMWGIQGWPNFWALRTRPGREKVVKSIALGGGHSFSIACS